MRIFHLVLIIGALFWESPVSAQDDSSSIILKLTDLSERGIPDITYSLFQGNDSISSWTTDLNGDFEVVLKLEFQTDYQLIPQNLPASDSKDILKFVTEYNPQDYVFNVRRQEPIIEHSTHGQIAFYRQNNTKEILEFEVQQILSIIEKHPEICIQFSQTIIRSESEKTAKKRKSNFLKFLEENGVDMSCIQFDKVTRILTAFDEDQRSRIQGAIASLDSKCN